ncbi:MAG TPA: hypothetical protein ACFYEK_10940 [Candidatus Wunengus sp. YC60]|uniref:hypothetical protein n=1 Tax=Candidatus Wunengus sp. YC60 TaxID=3367697 RepID=UPI004028BBE0
MTALVEANVTLTITRRTEHGGVKTVWGTVAFGDGALTYTVTTGIPFAKSKFGFVKEINYCHFFDTAASGYIPEYDRSQECIRMSYGDYSASSDGVHVECPSTVAPAAQTWEFKAEGY